MGPLKGILPRVQGDTVWGSPGDNQRTHTTNCVPNLTGGTYGIREYNPYVVPI